jgi:hypothetical protein
MYLVSHKDYIGEIASGKDGVCIFAIVNDGACLHVGGVQGRSNDLRLGLGKREVVDDNEL